MARKTGQDASPRADSSGPTSSWAAAEEGSRCGQGGVAAPSIRSAGCVRDAVPTQWGLSRPTLARCRRLGPLLLLPPGRSQNAVSTRRRKPSTPAPERPTVS